MNNSFDASLRLFDAVWTRYANDFEEAERFDLKRYLGEPSLGATSHLEAITPMQSRILDEGITTLILCDKHFSNYERNAQRNAFLAQLSRAIERAICIRSMLRTGYEEAARAVSRSFLDSIDVALACLVDRKFSTEFLSFKRSANNLWKKKIGQEEIDAYLIAACKIAGLDEAEAEDFVKERKNQKTLLSDFIHADSCGTFLSSHTPVLSYSDKFSFERYRAANSHTMGHILLIAGEVQKFLFILIGSLTSGWKEHPFEAITTGKDIDSFLSQAAAYQDFYYKHSFPVVGGVSVASI